MRKSMNRVTVPKDVAALCEQIAKGYERRKKAYEERRLDIIYSTGSTFADPIGGSRSPRSFSDPCANKAERLEKLERSLDAKFITAVEQSLMNTGTDVSRDSRERLRKAILLNCESGREHPYEFLGIDEFSRRDFYRRKERFITGIAVALGIIDI